MLGSEGGRAAGKGSSLSLAWVSRSLVGVEEREKQRTGERQTRSLPWRGQYDLDLLAVIY
eukprot:1411808-Pleurochrysis_carterae.AAC.1